MKKEEGYWFVINVLMSIRKDEEMQSIDAHFAYSYLMPEKAMSNNNNYKKISVPPFDAALLYREVCLKSLRTAPLGKPLGGGRGYLY